MRGKREERREERGEEGEEEGRIWEGGEGGWDYGLTGH